MSARTRPPAAWVALALVLAVAASYAEVGGFAFVRYDDPDYVLENPAVRGGLSWDNVRWAFTETHASNWHPLTWLAHMLDVELFGLGPAAHHWASVATHALATVLCFLALRALTARPWPSAFVAALFALHPLRVESVAWVSERKDVLAGVLFFATLLAYALYARAPSVARGLVVTGAFALGLLAKPMLVTLPFLLLLIDAWPLGRFEPGGGWSSARRLLLEKLPLFVLAGLSAAVTLHAQRAGGALRTLEALPLEARLLNAPLALMGYLARFAWPTELAYFYPHPHLAGEASPWGRSIGALGALLLASLLALRVRRRAPALALGWCWFLGLLVPVLGIVQVGEQALADRYSYLPSVGLALALAFPLADAAARFRRLRLPIAVAATLVLGACALASRRQARTWRDSETLHRHALLVTARNYAAWTGLGNELATRRDLAGARTAYGEALALRPDYAPALYGLGLLEQEHGDPERALELYRAALANLPGLAAAALNLGALLAQRGEDVDAALAFERVLELFPAHPDAHHNLGALLLRRGAASDARTHLEAALAARPESFESWAALAIACALSRDFRAAVEAQERALALAPNGERARARERLEHFRRGELPP
jgi:tetratricopeptide (TPR) repeat protein